METFEEYLENRSPREKLQDDYINRVIDGMDIKDLVQYAYDRLSEELDEFSDDDFFDEVQKIYPDLMESLEDDLNEKDNQ